MQTRGGFLDERGDPGVEFRLRRTVAVGNRTRAGAYCAEHVLEDFAVEVRLAAEVVVNHRLVDAGFLGDAVDAGGGIAALGEFGGGGLEDELP